ncbi:MAG: hypothetical protein AB3N63_18080 [Puniceicoccaceae bacterium]
MHDPGSEIEEKLAQLRPAEAVEVPEEFVDDSPLDLLQCKPMMSISAPPLIAIDLDDTLLNSDWTCKSVFEDIKPDWKVQTIRYDQLQHSLKGRLQKMRGLPIPFQYDLNAYPFLKNPQVYVQFRPGFLEELIILAELGVDFLLITASSQKRVDFLFKRLPVLQQLFSDRVISAETSARVLQEIEQMPESEIREQSELGPVLLDASLAMHQDRPCSLAAKSPLLVERALGLPAFSCLIDDSEITHDLFTRAGLEDLIIPVHGKSMDVAQTKAIFSDLYSRLELPMTPPDDPVKLDIIHLEDPYYYPLIHMQDQLV